VLTRALSATAILASALLIAAAPAGAVIAGNFGVQPRFAPGAETEEPLQYNGGPVLHSSDAYVIYWDPAETYRFDWKRLIDKYFQDVGAASGQLGNVFAVNAQYTDSTGRAANQSTYRGSYTTTDPYPTSENCTEPAALACLTDAQVRAELQKVIASGALPGATGPPVYYVLTPPGVTVCTNASSSSTCSNSTLLENEAAESELKKETVPAKAGICGYHSAINPGAPGQVVYAVQPWVAGNAGMLVAGEQIRSPTALACQDGNLLEEPNQLSARDLFSTYGEGLADAIINDLSIEQRNIVVDPLLTGWYQTATKAEEADVECRFDFGPPPESPPKLNEHTHAANRTNETINGDIYYLQWAFNSSGVTSGAGLPCWGGVALDPHFTAPNPVNSGDVVGFDATESQITLDANTKGLPGNEPYVAPSYKWEFGDATSASGANASAFHSYQYGGTYTVTLTVTDGAGNTASTFRLISVVGPPAPAPAGSGGSGGSSQGGAGSSQGGAVSSSGTAGKPAAAPVATAAILSHKLHNLGRKGLLVGYSVNGQVTGHFEVLIATSLARKLRLHGPPAVGLPVGTPPQTVIGKAILVTTKAGHGTLSVQLAKKAASVLERQHKVSLMIRLLVRNASSGVVTVLSTITLQH
jgi:PKD domain